MTEKPSNLRRQTVVAIVLVGLGAVAYLLSPRGGELADVASKKAPAKLAIAYKPFRDGDMSGLVTVLPHLKWNDPTSMAEIRKVYESVAARVLAKLEGPLPSHDPAEPLARACMKASVLLYEGRPHDALRTLAEARLYADSAPSLAAEWRYTLVYFQGVASLRLGEDENCVACRGDGACIYPLGPTAVHATRAGSEGAKAFFGEYLERFPDDDGARWLLNLAYMTLGEHPHGVPPRHLIDSAKFGRDMDVGKFKDVAHLVGVDRTNMAGGAVMDDFDGDGLLDLAVSDWGNSEPLALFRNRGDGKFEDRAQDAGLADIVGGLNISQADFDNDGRLDLVVPRGAWVQAAMPTSLLRQNEKGRFVDVAAKAGVQVPSNSNCAAWADFDNDGWLDLFVCNETGPNRMFRNRGDRIFEEIADAAGVAVARNDAGKRLACKGAAWLDYDGDGLPDLFVNHLNGPAVLYRNLGNRTFSDATRAAGITGPRGGFTCWAFDYDNDGRLDLFATCYERTLGDLVRDLEGKPPLGQVDHTRLFRNLGGAGFRDVSLETGIGGVFATMGASFGDVDNDGFLDVYLGTGDPSIATLTPNRMFKNVGGQRFADITATAGVGLLQKGHAVAFGDWDRDGNVDVFAQTGGAVPGDRFRCALFQNPGHPHSWLTVKLVGKKTNRSAFGARIKIVVEGTPALTVYRTVGYGSSFGGNPLEQTVGLAAGKKIALLEVHWPTSRSTQSFRDLDVNQSIVIEEFAPSFRRTNPVRIGVPTE